LKKKEQRRKMSTSITTANNSKIERRRTSEKVARKRARGGESFPLTRTVANFFEPWMFFAMFGLFGLSAVGRYFGFIGTLWLFLIPLLSTAIFVIVRLPVRLRELKFKKQEYTDSLQRAARYRALVKPARDAVDQLIEEKYAILEKSEASGQNLTQVLSKLDEYENDYTDLLYLYQERSRRLKSIRERDFVAARQTLAEDRARLAESADKNPQTHERMLTALAQQESLITRQEQVAADLDSSLHLIKQQARNIQSMFALVSDQISTMPLGVNWAANFDEFEVLSDSIQATKETLNSMGDSY
jgi:hypothetical protein